MHFEWDPNKAASNFGEHGVAFEDATAVFKDVYALHIIDRSMDYDEERFVTIGMVEGIILYVAYTERGDVIRVISARRATRLEQRAYDRERQR